ncbi:MAG TPA: adenylate kinase [Acidimicrobiales bacterium]|nr:adenylate kinase [Acidimicrobiales bacterium]
MVRGVRLVILGRQGAGKGTQCMRLARHYVVPHVSTGDIFRASVKAGSEFGLRADEFMRAGKLVPDEIVVGVVRERLCQRDARARGFILDGFPRTADQAEALDEMLVLEGMPLDVTIDLEIAEEDALTRLAARRVCSTCATIYSTSRPPAINWTCDNCGGEVVQRQDDTEEAIRKRLADYNELTTPLIEWYTERHSLVHIQALGTPDEVLARLVRAIDNRRVA